MTRRDVGRWGRRKLAQNAKYRCNNKPFFDSSNKLHIVPIIPILRYDLGWKDIPLHPSMKVFTSRGEHLLHEDHRLKITIPSPWREGEGRGARRRKRSRRRRRSTVDYMLDVRRKGRGGSKIEGRIVKPSPLPNGQTSRLSGNPAVYGFHKRGPSRERASYGSKIRDRLSVRRLCAPLTLFRGWRRRSRRPPFNNDARRVY